MPSPEPEPVRLLIWDLDETFWHGTLSEGGISLRPDTIDIVKQLARRGILSAICSKNDFDRARRILQDAGVWEYFILPSIDWQPKGPRIAALIETAQLRASTVLFIDDNPINLEEAKYLVPGIQTRSNAFIDQILNDPLFTGKDDPELARLNQYKLLERRKADEFAAGADIAGYLRSSNIKVRFDHEVIDNLDRAVELINRTNQLNFTKKRLPEDVSTARQELRTLLARHDVRAALIGVRDNYGDHGWCGIYVLNNDSRLLQFAFSCRILGLEVETWLYQKLGRPHLDIQGEVVTDVKRPDAAIDWIHLDEAAGMDAPSSAFLFERVVARGGCDLMPIAHYFGPYSEAVVGEFNVNRHGMDARIDHSTFLRAALSGGLDGAALRAAEELGYAKRDFDSAITESHRSPEIWILSFWSDAAYVLYRHRQFGFTVPFSLAGHLLKDARQANPDLLRSTGMPEQTLKFLDLLKSDYEYVGFVSELEFKDTVNQVFASAQRLGIRVFVVGANEYFIPPSGVGEILGLPRAHNRWLADVALPYPNVTILNIRDYVRSETEIHTPYHFDRLVYFRLFEAIKSRLLEPGAAPPQSWAVHTAADLDAALTAPHSAYTLSRTASFLLADGRCEYALRFAAKAVELDPDRMTHRIAYVRALSKSGDRADIVELLDAKSWLARAALLPGSLLHELGVCLLEAGDLENAAEAFAYAVQSEPDVFHHRHRLANVLEKLGRPADTYAVLQESVDRGDQNPHVLAHIARLLIKFGRLLEARELLQSCLDRDPAFPPFCAALRGLELAERALAPASGDEGEDIACNKPAMQSSVSPWSRGGPGEDARGANCGAVRPDFGFHTAREFEPWWQVDLEHTFIVEKICLLNRFSYPQRLRNFSLLASLDATHWELLYQKTDGAVFGNPDDLPLVLKGAALARFIRVRLDGEGMLHFRSFQAFGRRAEAIDAGAARRFVEVPHHAVGGRSWIREFCHRHGLDEQLVRQPLLDQTLRIRALPHQEFRGDIKVIRIGRWYGRFGNIFYQLLNAFVIARRVNCRNVQIPPNAHLRALPLLIEDIQVAGWPSDAEVEPTLVGCLFAPAGFQRFFGDYGSAFLVDTVHRCLLPLYQDLLADVAPLGRNVLAMHFRGGDVFTRQGDGHIHAWYVQPPASYYLMAFDYAQRHLGVDSACLVFEDRSNPAVDCVERELCARGISCQLQSADVRTDLKCLLGASHIVPSYGTFCEAIALLSANCETYFGFRRLSCAHDVEGFPQSRVDEMLRAMGVRTYLIDDLADRYIPRRHWTASDEQLHLIRTYPQASLELKEIGSTLGT